MPAIGPIRLFAVILGIGLTTASAAQDLMRGKQLFETQCLQCHTTGIYKRPQPTVKNWPELVKEVGRWQRELGQAWTAQDISDVAAYLNERFYNFQRPTEVSRQR